MSKLVICKLWRILMILLEERLSVFHRVIGMETAVLIQAEMERASTRRLASAEVASRTLDQRLRELGERRASLASAEMLSEEVENLRLK